VWIVRHTRWNEHEVLLGVTGNRFPSNDNLALPFESVKGLAAVSMDVSCHRPARLDVYDSLVEHLGVVLIGVHQELDADTQTIPDWRFVDFVQLVGLRVVHDLLPVAST
jgi:hypothetical protein